MKRQGHYPFGNLAEWIIIRKSYFKFHLIKGISFNRNAHLGCSQWARSRWRAISWKWWARETSCPWEYLSRWRPGYWCCSGRCAFWTAPAWQIILNLCWKNIHWLSPIFREKLVSWESCKSDRCFSSLVLSSSLSKKFDDKIINQCYQTFLQTTHVFNFYLSSTMKHK